MHRSMTTHLPTTRPARIQIQRIWPMLDCGRFPIKRTLGDEVHVGANVFCDGNDVVRAVVRYGPAGATEFLETPMELGVDDRWHGVFTPSELGRWHYTITAWIDRFASWQWELSRKVEAGQADLSSELLEGAALLGVDNLTVEEGLDSAIAPDSPRVDETSSDALEVIVDRERARFGSWYELFPRSWGGFKGVERELPKLAELGVDVLYFPPIHPIGHSHRKGRNNALVAAPGDPGSPWAIGGPEGGHTEIHPDLGTIDDFDRLVARASDVGIEIALDFAIQCSPDHPWLREHPEWFHHRPDGTLKYAENPPKRYQDIYNFNLESEDWQGVWEALRDVVLYWVAHGVKAFRVDNPHTKPVAFWEWLIREVQDVDPEVVLLSEAFTRPPMMATLAKVGFSQSYTYFTWRNTRGELTGYVEELTRGDMPEFFRPNLFANTPDILHEYLQQGGRPAFESRLVLAATLSPSYGIYSGFEHCENVPAAAGSEEYLDSEKYELRTRALDGPLLPLLARLNRVRRENPALQRLANVTFLETENDELIAYAKREGRNIVIVCVNLDPIHSSEGVAIVPTALGLAPTFRVSDLLDGAVYTWHVGQNYVRLDPGSRQAHVLRVET
jgi:starch synthase (maltosyl-transferring)